MKKVLMLAISGIILSMNFFGFAEAANTYHPKTAQTYIQGPKGGCYYINKNGNKTYVDRKLCEKKKNK